VSDIESDDGDLGWDEEDLDVPSVPEVPTASLSYREAVALIEARGLGITPDLRRIEALAELLDHPERSYPTVQVAGTNGKSTTARMIGAVLGAHGLISGIYTSPHLQGIRERFALSGRSDEERVVIDLIAPDELAGLVQYLVPFVELVEGRLGERVTYFELTTALAFEWMANHSVAAGIYEAGLGGSWDATNIVAGDVGVLAPIAVDHVAMLGPTPLDNAREKVGIIKPGSRCVSAGQEPEVAELIIATAEARGAALAMEGRDFWLRSDDPALGGRLISVEGPQGGVYPDVFVPLFGSHQARNATLAVAACEELLGRALDPDAVAAGFRSVTSPGRLEVVARDPLVVLDGAHNPHAAAALGPALEATFGGMPKFFVISIFADKDAEGVLRALAPYADRMIFWESSSPKATPVGALVSVATAVGVPEEALRTAESLEGAMDTARAMARGGGMVVVTGSLYAVGQARDSLVGPIA
jgi:dihydrofolate synthase/folylpolyglutamate synthase